MSTTTSATPQIANAQGGFLNTVKPVFNQNQFGGTLGERRPIKKDRTFFFLSYEGRRVRQGQPGQLLNVPTAAEEGRRRRVSGGPLAVVFRTLWSPRRSMAGRDVTPHLV